MDRDESFGKGLRVRVHAACSGRGTVVFTVTSGRAAVRRTVPCADTPGVVSFDLTTAATALSVERSAGRGSRGGAAYRVDTLG
ncbi:hypothetical protein LO771_01220 [Streptacidiphilus sp. ASG 303]|uniref:hypothetical protein n=1 Tax=Streptacidiphilus sp. ASG 303 TaxID=2896847 RepID=UPI001E4EE2E8|nr:hypothetical protein [Streptacidiphilus sp. ASG 303]MCD0481067.1 hypothetical protein [Streptacidiphilus sp. ASG 303]